MKSISLLLLAFIFSCSAMAQRTVQLRNLWADPQVHVLFQGYTISFTIKDIDKALQLLAETGDSTYGASSGLDTAKAYGVELYEGIHTEYRNSLQPLLQDGVGTFLLTAGHAEIRNKKHKKLSAIIMDIQPVDENANTAYIIFYDPKNHKMLFSGTMNVDMYKKDLGLY